MKKIYRFLVNALKQCVIRLEFLKTYLCEIIAIHHKKNIWRTIVWSEEQQKNFNDYWTEITGRKISGKWAKLYQAQNGHFCKNYFPEFYYSCYVEPKLNDYFYSDVLQDKSLLENLCANGGAIFPKTITVCSGGYYYDSHRNVISAEESLDLIRTSVATQGVIKPTRDSSSGKGIYFVSQDTPDLSELVDKVYRETRGNYIVQQVIEQHPIFNQINSSSINTLRIITYIADDKIYHAPVAMRLGRARSKVDNIHAGGLVIGVGNNGKLQAEAFELGYGDKSRRYTMHPDSKVKFADVTLPAIPGAIAVAKRLHGRFPHTGIISWDFTIGPKEEIILIEANLRGQGIWFPQVVNKCGLFDGHEKELYVQIK